MAKEKKEEIKEKEVEEKKDDSVINKSGSIKVD